MIIPLTETPRAGFETERRRSPRLMSSGEALFAEAVTEDGRMFRLRVGDLSTTGVKLLGSMPVRVGDRVRVGVQLDLSIQPFRNDAIVARFNEQELAVRFTSRR